MKKNVLSLLVLLAMVGVSSSSARAEGFRPDLLVQEPENTFAPMGFDDNDNAQIVLYGNLTSTCFKAGPAEARVDHDKKTVYVRNTVYHYTGCWCAEVMVPYLNTVSLGVLGAGDYNVVLEKSDGTFAKMASLPIRISKTNSPDDFLYAPVDHTHFNTKGSTRELVLEGTFQNSCMKLKDVKLTYRPNHVIEVQPIVEMGTENCVAEPRPFEAKVTVRDDLHGRALIHVRSLNGQSLNQVVEL